MLFFARAGVKQVIDYGMSAIQPALKQGHFLEAAGLAGMAASKANMPR